MKCDNCQHFVFEDGDYVPYGNTYVRTPGGYICECENNPDDCEEDE